MKPIQTDQTLSENQQIKLHLLHIFHSRLLICNSITIYSSLSLGGLVWYFSLTQNNINAWFWNVLTVSSGCVGFYIKSIFDNYPSTLSSATRWNWVFALYCCASGLCWGSGAAYVCWSSEGISIAVVTAVLLCVCSISISLAISQLYATWLFITGAIFPPAIFLLLKQTLRHSLIAALLFLTLVMIIFVAYSVHQALRAQIRTEIQLRRAAQEAQLARAQADQANSFKSQFLANMSHEIRTPMNAVLGMLKLLQYTELNAQQFDYTRKSEGAAKTMLGLLNDILDFSKIEAGKVTLNMQPLRLNCFMQDVMQLLQTYASNKPIKLNLKLDSSLPEAVLCDALRLRQVLINLGGNAIKFTEQGEVNLHIQQLQNIKNITTLRFEVQDSGIGIAVEKQSQIFEKFTQAESSTTRRFGGTGLGLTISKQLVQAMGGNIQLKSIVGQGSTFTFELHMQTIHWNPEVFESNEEIYWPARALQA